MTRILTINGSTRVASTNSLFIRAITAMMGDRAVVIPASSVAELPHFDVDKDLTPALTSVAHFREQIRDADGILICTPEYAMGVPGSLKNALDWTVSSADFRLKPVMLVTASLSGEKAHASLLGTLRVIEAHVPDDTTVLVPFARTKVDADGITDAATRSEIEQALKKFLAASQA